MFFNEISSRKNERILNASRLHDKKTRDKEGLFFTEGFKLLQEALYSHLTVDSIFFTKKALSEYSDLIEKSKCDSLYLVTDEVYDKLSCEDSPQGIFAVIRKRDISSFDKTSIKEGGFLLLEDIQNPLNLGAIFRCAYSLGCSKIVMTKECVDVYNPKVLRGAMGSIFKTQFIYCDNFSDFIRDLQTSGNRVFCTHLHSESVCLGSFDFMESDSIVIGNEGRGIKQETVNLCSDCVIIPMQKGAESLNAATAASVILWEKNRNKLINK